jgi:futalosine hydrolase
MKLLLVAATGFELEPTSEYLRKNWNEVNESFYTKGDNSITTCISGVGIMATAYTLSKQLQDHFDLALQAGVGGGFDRELKLGQLVFIKSEQLGDLGAEDHYSFLDLFDLDLLKPGAAPFTGKELVTPILPVHEKIDLPHVNGITVNTVAGSEFTVQMRKDKFAPQVESMEGAAFHYVCLKEKIPFAQIRSISNYAEPRDKTKWQMKEAIIALNKWLIDFIETI